MRHMLDDWQVGVLRGVALDAALYDVARLRMAVFRDWPYLYHGDMGYERRYLAGYRDNPHAVLVGAFAAGRLIGAATGMPLTEHDAAFGAAIAAAGHDPASVFYCAESVLLPEWRGRGIGHRFFDLREAAARDQGFRLVAFCAVIRPDDHPLKPADYRPLDGFWRKRGYAPLDGAMAPFAWTDIDQAGDTEKPMQIWMRAL
jgi:GNAT superfamily N-acetyltransferase